MLVVSLKRTKKLFKQPKKYTYIIFFFLFQSSRKSAINSKEELSQTTIALEKAHEICVSSKSTVDLICDLNELYKCLR